MTIAQERKDFEANLNDAKKEAKQPVSDGRTQGIIGIVFGLIGLLNPFGLGLLFAILAGILATYANHHGHRKLGIVGGILAILDVGIWMLIVNLGY